MWVTQTFLFFFCNSFCLLTFWFRGFVFKWNLDQARETHRCLRAVVGQDLMLGHMIWKNYGQGVLVRYLDRGWFYSCPSFRDGVGAVKYCLNRCTSYFSFPSKFVIVLLYRLLVDCNTFLKMCIFKMSYWLHWWLWLWKPKCICCNNNKNKSNKELVLVILNCTLQQNQNDRWTLP
jgi:hypothetical protein